MHQCPVTRCWMLLLHPMMSAGEGCTKPQDHRIGYGALCGGTATATAAGGGQVPGSEPSQPGTADSIPATAAAAARRVSSEIRC